MDAISPAQLQQYVQSEFPGFFAAPIEIGDIVFEQRNALLCFYCSRYNNKWTCPPRTPKCDYASVFREYDHALLVGHTEPIGKNYEISRYDSSVQLHRVLLSLENYLLENGNYVRISFIGGSCKLCKNGCAPDKCRNPYLARIPLESTGVNVVKTAGKAGISVRFPVKDAITRIGLLLW